MEGATYTPSYIGSLPNATNNLVSYLKNLVSISVTTEDIFDQLCQSETFIHEAEVAKKQLAKNLSSFTNLNEKYSYLIEQKNK